MSNFLRKNIIVVGLGVSGRSAVDYCLRKNWSCTVIDTRAVPPGLNEFQQCYPEVEFIHADLTQFDFSKFDQVVLSPGISIDEPMIQEALNQGIEVVGDVELFLREIEVPVIAITGSNGKSTVCDLLGHCLNHVGIKTEVAGNIGTPVLSLLEQPQPDVYVLELSSFQLETISSLKAAVACVLNVTPDHLDRHLSMANYAAIKYRIYQGASAAVVNLNDEFNGLLPSAEFAGKVSTFGFASGDYTVTSNASGYQVELPDNQVLDESMFLLKGHHNGLNIAAVCAVLNAFNVAIESDLIAALASYRGLPHRCELVRSNDGITWINDSKATNPGAAAAAINGFSNHGKSLFLIAGGDAKGNDLSEFIDAVKRHAKQCFVFGQDAERISEQLDNRLCESVRDLNQAVDKSRKVATPGDVVLLSPACASIDMYPNYMARGEHFKALVGGLHG